MNCFVMVKSSDGGVKSSRVEVSCVVIVVLSYVRRGQLSCNDWCVY